MVHGELIRRRLPNRLICFFIQERVDVIFFGNIHAVLAAELGGMFATKNRDKLNKALDLNELDYGSCTMVSKPSAIAYLIHVDITFGPVRYILEPENIC